MKRYWTDTSKLVAAVTAGFLQLTAGQAFAQAGAEGGAIPYLTLRAQTGSTVPSAFYGDERGSLRAGICNVASTNIPIMSNIAERSPFRVPDEIVRLSSIEEAPVESVLDSLVRSAGDGSALLYVHGFNMDFDKACRRAFVFSRAVGLEDRFLLYSWPSDGVPVNYTQDEADVNWSAPDIADAIADLAGRLGPGRLDVAGHSLGGRGVVIALYDLASRYPEVQLGEVVLIAPDIDFQLFEKILPQIRDAATNITVYVADNDRPLALSAQVHGYPRLGQTGNDVSKLEGVTVIDVSSLPLMSPTGHLYHLHSPQVAEDLGRLLKDGLDPQGRGLGSLGTNLWSID